MKINGKRVEMLLRQCGWSEYELARKLKLNYSYVWRVLRGQRGIGRKFISSLMRLCEKQGLEFNEFVIQEREGTS